MPVVEAMACGTPVVCSTHPSLDEAAGRRCGASTSEGPVEIVRGIEEARERRDELVPAGLAHARRFTWRATGARCCAVRGTPREGRARRLAARLTRAGSARYVAGLRDALASHVEVASWLGAGSGRHGGAPRRGLVPARAAPRPRGADVLHCPTFRAPFRSRMPLVVTVLDLAVLRRPALQPLEPDLQPARRRCAAVRAARRVIAISEFTKGERGRALAVEPPARARDRRAAASRSPRRASAPRATTCSRSGRSSRARTCSAPRRPRARRRRAPRRTRGWGGVDRERRALARRGRRRRARTALRGARAARYPSLYEGFGIPILEAMAVGTPVVTIARRRDRGGRRRRGRPRRPARPEGHRGRSGAGGPARAPSCAPLGLERARIHLGRRRARVRSRSTAGHSAVIVVDADFLGRGRTGDETYVENLLRALAATRSASRLAARDAALVPDGIEPLELLDGLAGAAHGVVAAAPAPAASVPSSPTSCTRSLGALPSRPC